MEVVRFIGPPPISGFEEVEEHVARSFTLALEALEYEEHCEEASCPKSLAKNPSQDERQIQRF